MTQEPYEDPAGSFPAERSEAGNDPADAAAGGGGPGGGPVGDPDSTPVRIPAGRRPLGVGAGPRPRRGKRLVAPEDAAKATRSLTPEQRLLVLDTWQRSGLPARDFSTIVGVSHHTLYAWKRRFEELGPAGLTDGATKRRPTGSKLPEATKRAIVMLKQANPEWGCQRISDVLYRGPGLPASAPAVTRVLKEAGYVTEERQRARTPESPGGEGEPIDDGVKANPTTKQCMFNGKPLELVFDGESFGSGTPCACEAVSGKPTQIRDERTVSPGGLDIVSTYKYFDYTRRRQRVREIGPTPEGGYWLDTCKKGTTSWYGGSRPAWGKYFWELTPYPGTDVTASDGRNRHSMYVHGGWDWGSKGCIDLRGGIDQFEQFASAIEKQNGGCCHIVIKVDYGGKDETRKKTCERIDYCTSGDRDMSPRQRGLRGGD